MTLSIEHIGFTNFRNYERFELNDIGALTLFVGPNAVGKTNIVEGIQLMTALSSFRHPLIDQVIKHGESYARTEARVTGDDRVLDIVMLLESHKRKYTLNGKARRPADLKGLVPSVSFTPDDLDLVKGSMSVRRAAIDALGSQLSPNHYLIKKDYEKVIRYKNRLLKEEAQVALIDSINETLVTCGAQLACYRAALFGKLAPEISRRYADIAQGEKLQVTYVPSWMTPVSRETPCGVASFSRDEARDALASALEARHGEELARRKSVVGPHSDEIGFYIEGKNAGNYGSQGQQRSIVLACKLAEASIIEDMLSQKPVLLLDDVMSELDEHRRHALVEFISGDMQTFITTANLAYFDDSLLKNASVVQLGEEAKRG